MADYNIRVNTICPTFVVTPMTKNFLKNNKFKKNMLAGIPLKRFAELPEIATAVVFLGIRCCIYDYRYFIASRWWLDSKIIKYLIIAFLFSFNASALDFSNKFTQGAFIFKLKQILVKRFDLIKES